MRDAIYRGAVLTVLNEAKVQYPHIDDLWSALEWKIKRRPEIGVAVSGQFYVYKQQRARKTDPDIVVIYEFDNHSVTISSVQIKPLLSLLKSQ